DGRSSDTPLLAHALHGAAPLHAELAASRQVMSVASPRASVIIRTKDSARTLPGALASVRAQTVACEVVVVDSGSRDATLSIARAGARSEERRVGKEWSARR